MKYAARSKSAGIEARIDSGVNGKFNLSFIGNDYNHCFLKIFTYIEHFSYFTCILHTLTYILHTRHILSLHMRCRPVDEQAVAADICSRRVELEHVAMIPGDSPGLVLGTKNRV